MGRLRSLLCDVRYQFSYRSIAARNEWQAPPSNCTRV